MKAGEYFTAVAGLAMIRNVVTDTPRARERMADVRRIVEKFDEFPQSLDIPVQEHDVASGYARWAPSYDGPNPAIEREAPIVVPLLSSLPRGRALDAACGTGRHAATLARLGHDVVGVDATEAMLKIAREKVPGADFRVGALEALPVDDGSIDVLTCSLALTHVERLEPVIREFARVLKPGGNAVISDMHPFVAMTSGVAAFQMEDGSLGVPYVVNRVHQASEYVQAFISAGLTIVSCIEPQVTEDMITRFPTFAAYPDATREAYVGLPYLLIWHLRKL
jgi:ubiquinone/menaquinone biosynthesis C-methylase UbiE